MAGTVVDFAAELETVAAKSSPDLERIGRMSRTGGVSPASVRIFLHLPSVFESGT